MGCLPLGVSAGRMFRLVPSFVVVGFAHILVGEPASTSPGYAPATNRGDLNMAIVGSGAYAYEPVENWAKLPPGWSFKEIGGVGVDKRDNVYVFNRGEHPMIVFDRDGNFLRSFGEGLFPRAHGVFMAPDDTI